MGPAFPYSARAAVDSLVSSDPGAAVEIHLLGPAPRGEHFATLEDRRCYPSVSIHPIDLDTVFEGIDVIDPARLRAVLDRIPARAYAARSNLLRYALLFHRGGVYVDFDVLARRPLHDLAGGGAFVGAERVWSHDRSRVEGRWRPSMAVGTIGWSVCWLLKWIDSRCFAGRFRVAHGLGLLDPFWTTLQVNNAVIGAPPGSPFVLELLRSCLLVDPAVRYALGPSLVSDVVHAHPHLVRVLPEPVLYAVPPGESHRLLHDRHLRLEDRAALIHWVQSNHRRFAEQLQPDDPRTTHPEGAFWSWLGAVERQRATAVDEVAPT
jgi:hypothetical protein